MLYRAQLGQRVFMSFLNGGALYESADKARMYARIGGCSMDS